MGRSPKTMAIRKIQTVTIMMIMGIVVEPAPRTTQPRISVKM